jgi:hypothetical protein
MIDRYGLGLGDSVRIDVEGHAVFDALVDETLHRLALFSRRSLFLFSGRSIVHGRMLSYKARDAREAPALASSLW